MPSVLALDLSASRTGICLDGDVWSFTPRRGPVLDRARDTAATVRQFAVSADLVVIEAIGTRMISAAIALATVHAIVLDRIDGAKVQMVTPADLKRYAVGKGNADKDAVMLAAAKMQPAIVNNDEADAYWLWAIGYQLTADYPMTVPAYRQTIIDKLRETDVS